MAQVFYFSFPSQPIKRTRNRSLSDSVGKTDTENASKGDLVGI